MSGITKEIRSFLFYSRVQPILYNNKTKNIKNGSKETDVPLLPFAPVLYKAGLLSVVLVRYS